MTQAIGARRDGDAFQARLFWLKAAHLLDDYSRVVRVGFEHGPKGFDDIWVEYDLAQAPQDPRGVPLRKEFFQCKWHVSPGTYTHVDLTKPEFISATTHSLLQRAHAALAKEGTGNGAIRFKLVTNWQLHKADRLFKLVRNRSHTLKVDELFEGSTAKSGTYLIRKLWKEHLGVNEGELHQLASALGLSAFGESLEAMRDRLDLTCKAFGMKRVPAESSAVIYDDIVRQWASQGRNVFDRKSFHQSCSQEKLLDGGKRRSIVFGVKSFEHPIDRLEDRCTEVLNLVAEFDDRLINDTSAWQNILFPALKTFLAKAAASSERLRLSIDTHMTLAFAAGMILDTKSGRTIELEQRSPTTIVWAPDDSEASPTWPQWELTVHQLNAATAEVGVGICLTHDVEPKVRSYLAHRPEIGTLLVFKPTGGASSQSVVSGAHAYALAEQLAARVKGLRETSEFIAPNARSHLFMAAPNGFVFYLGRHFQSLKPLTLYEFDFENQAIGSYSPSLSIPQDSP